LGACTSLEKGERIEGSAEKSVIVLNKSDEKRGSRLMGSKTTGSRGLTTPNPRQLLLPLLVIVSTIVTRIDRTPPFMSFLQIWQIRESVFAVSVFHSQNNSHCTRGTVKLEILFLPDGFGEQQRIRRSNNGDGTDK
jgi:hypothetical protein